MFGDVDLRKLAEMTAPERAFLSVYLAGPRSAAELEKRFQKVRRVLKGGEAEKDERDLWEKIRAEYLRGGLGVVGLDEVLSAAREGRVDTAIVNRTFKPEGRRCRDCENLDVGPVEQCSACGSRSLFEVDVVNEIVEMLRLSSAEADFVDPIDTLAEAGDIAALLRYRV